MIEIEEVLEAITAPGFITGVRARKIDFLTSSFSVAASTARSVWPMTSSLSLVEMWPRAVSMVAWSITSRCTCLARFFLMVSITAVSRSAATSWITTS